MSQPEIKEIKELKAIIQAGFLAMDNKLEQQSQAISILDTRLELLQQIIHKQGVKMSQCQEYS